MVKSTEAATVTLRELPVEINVKEVAAGLLELFTAEERLILRFGMLPADKMRILEDKLRERFAKLGYAMDSDVYMSLVGNEIRDWSMKKLVAEAVHLVSVELYRIGDLVV